MGLRHRCCNFESLGKYGVVDCLTRLLPPRNPREKKGLSDLDYLAGTLGVPLAIDSSGRSYGGNKFIEWRDNIFYPEIFRRFGEFFSKANFDYIKNSENVQYSVCKKCSHAFKIYKTRPGYIFVRNCRKNRTISSRKFYQYQTGSVVMAENQIAKLENAIHDLELNFGNARIVQSALHGINGFMKSNGFLHSKFKLSLTEKVTSFIIRGIIDHHTDWDDRDEKGNINFGNFAKLGAFEWDTHGVTLYYMDKFSNVFKEVDKISKPYLLTEYELQKIWFGDDSLERNYGYKFNFIDLLEKVSNGRRIPFAMIDEHNQPHIYSWPLIKAKIPIKYMNRPPMERKIAIWPSPFFFDALEHSTGTIVYKNGLAGRIFKRISEVSGSKNNKNQKMIALSLLDHVLPIREKNKEHAISFPTIVNSGFFPLDARLLQNREFSKMIKMVENSFEGLRSENIINSWQSTCPGKKYNTLFKFIT